MANTPSKQAGQRQINLQRPHKNIIYAEVHGVTWIHGIGCFGWGERVGAGVILFGVARSVAQIRFVVIIGLAGSTEFLVQHLLGPCRVSLHIYGGSCPIFIRSKAPGFRVPDSWDLEGSRDSHTAILWSMVPWCSPSQIQGGSRPIFMVPKAPGFCAPHAWDLWSPVFPVLYSLGPWLHHAGFPDPHFGCSRPVFVGPSRSAWVLSSSVSCALLIGSVQRLHAGSPRLYLRPFMGVQGSTCARLLFMGS